MIQSKASNKLSVRSSAMLHFHDLDHVQIGFGGGSVDCEDGIDYRGS